MGMTSSSLANALLGQASGRQQGAGQAAPATGVAAAGGATGSTQAENAGAFDLSGFTLDGALSQAYTRALDFMNSVLAPENMNVEMDADAQNPTAQVRNLDSGKVIKEYDGHEVLKFFAENRQSKGLVIDGEI